jgi:hypothetical protein
VEFIDGVPLAGPLPLEKAVEYPGQILDALDAAHCKGITHRDLKPALYPAHGRVLRGRMYAQPYSRGSCMHAAACMGQKAVNYRVGTFVRVPKRLSLSDTFREKSDAVSRVFYRL